MEGGFNREEQQLASFFRSFVRAVSEVGNYPGYTASKEKKDRFLWERREMAVTGKLTIKIEA